MPNPALPDDAVLQRRRFLRGSALLAAAAGGAVAAAAGATPASAADASGELTLAIPSERMLDTTKEPGRELILASSSSAFDSKHRLKKNAWLDLALFPTDEGLELFNAFVNLTSLSSTGGGSLVVAEPGDKPTGTTLTYSKGKTVSNGALTGVVDSATVYPDAPGLYIVRIWATSVTHVQLDLTGLTAVSTDDGAAGARRSVRPALQRVKAAVHQARR